MMYDATVMQITFVFRSKMNHSLTFLIRTEFNAVQCGMSLHLLKKNPKNMNLFELIVYALYRKKTSHIEKLKKQ